MVGRPGVLRQNFTEACLLISRNLGQKFWRNFYCQSCPLIFCNESAPGFWAAVGIWYVRFYIKKGSTVQQIRTGDPQDRPLGCLVINVIQPDKRQSDGIGSKR